MIFTLQGKQFHHHLQSKYANHEFITLRNLAKARKRDQILRSSSHGSHMMNADKDKNKIILPTIQTSFALSSQPKKAKNFYHDEMIMHLSDGTDKNLIYICKSVK